MGSSGSGRLTDYPGNIQKSGGSGGSGGGSQSDRCTKAINTALEDVEQSAYFTQHQSVPPVGTQLQIVHEKRLVAKTSQGEAVGNLPTRFNYLAGCIKGGYTYVGQVRSSMKGPPASVAADFAPVT